MNHPKTTATIVMALCTLLSTGPAWSQDADPPKPGAPVAKLSPKERAAVQSARAASVQEARRKGEVEGTGDALGADKPVSAKKRSAPERKAVIEERRAKVVQAQKEGKVQGGGEGKPTSP